LNVGDPSAHEVSQHVNAINTYSSGDQKAIAAVIEDYFTSREDCDEEFDLGSGKCMHNKK